MLDAIQGIVMFDPAELSEISVSGIVVSLFLLTFISEDAACIAAGGLAAQGRLGMATAILVCFAGIVAGDIALYGIGRLTAVGVLKNRVTARVFNSDSFERAGKWLDQKGAMAIFASRFVTGLRLPTYLAAGFFRTGFWRFLAYFVLAATVWTPIAVGVSYFSTGVFAQGIFAGAIAAFVLIRMGFSLTTHENRRCMVGRAKRVMNWEFWPLPVFYLPVVLYCLFLAFRYRSLTLFTAANPCIPGGGFAGESKDAIYDLVAGSAAAQPRMLKHQLISGKSTLALQLELASAFVDHHALSFPLVLKPDVGERGRGVCIARNHADVEAYLGLANGDTIVQEYVDGVEISVFYCRFPTDAKGQIFSITEKGFPHVVGNGVSTLRDLILNDSRAVALAESYFRQNIAALDKIPDMGESVKLIEIGTHSKGAIFLDGGWLRTEKLELAIEDICGSIEGFYFGRFDLRARTFEDFKNGGPFRIIELNGVASESTNIYDPRYSLIAANRILFRQWRLAFEIGSANVKRGFQPTTVADLVRLVLGLDRTANLSFPQPSNS